MKAYELIEILKKVDPETKLFLNKEHSDGGDDYGEITPMGSSNKVIADMNRNHKFCYSQISRYGWEAELSDGQEKVIILGQ